MISDERLREAARKVEESMLASLPEPEECEATFSPEFERKMEKLLHRAGHPIRKRIMKAVACFLLAVLVGGGSVLTFSVEARAAFIGWMRETYESWFVYRYIGENQANPENVSYCLTWLPNGYYESSRFDTDTQTNIIYENDDNNLITFYYAYNADVTSLYLEQESVNIKSVLIGNTHANLYMDKTAENANSIVWIDEKSETLFWIAASCSEEELIQMAAGVVAEQ